MQTQGAMEAFLNASKTALVTICCSCIFRILLYIILHSTRFIRCIILQSRLSFCQTVRVVLGNPTCDLDSAVCTLVQGLLEYTDAKKQGLDNVAVIPVMNVPEREFRIKTEVVYSLKSHGIPLNLLTFR